MMAIKNILKITVEQTNHNYRLDVVHELPA